ncbi:MAG: hypothetical protein QOF60_215 [Actinomycetota bacterium]|nr:hypothetical protein [Actinomycetota bacterium]
MGFVRTIRQPARTGAKAYVEWYPHHEVIAAWFPDAWPPEGAYVVATGRLSHGAHHEETVFYVDRGELRITPNYAPEAYERRRRLRPDAIDSNG